MSNRIPNGWAISTLSDLAFIDQQSLKGSTEPDYRFKYIDIASVKTARIDVPSSYITFGDSPSRARKIVQKGDVLMSTVRPNLQSFAYFDKEGDDFVVSTGFAVITAKKSSDGRFLYQSILSDDVSRQVESLVAGSNYPAISSANVKCLEVLAPPLPEQQKIATILSSVDDVIEKTRAQIDKLKDLKTGMMQELLTKGVGHTEFKDSELGDIPLTWDVKLLGEVYPKIVVGYVGNVNDFYCEKDNGVPFYRTLNIRDGFIRNDPVKYVTKEFNEKNKKSQIFNDDILIARVGANLGMTCKVTGLESSANIANAIIIKSVKNASSDFFMEYIRSDYGQKQIMSEAAGGAQGVFNTSLAQGLVVPVPPLSEQIEIGRKLISFDKYIKLSETKMSCFLALKKALMQDLLTGKVRVKLTDKESAAS